MGSTREKRGSLLAAAMDAAALIAVETLWPTRCAVCERPGAVLCERCERALPYVDRWRACGKCGEPYGYVQCCACSDISLARAGCEKLPFTGCASATRYEGPSGKIVRMFKDAGERRLAANMAEIMARIVPPEWAFDILTFVPATPVAFRRRGFDHAQLLTEQLAVQLGVDAMSLFARPKTSDQRALGRAERIENLAGSFSVLPASKRHCLMDGCQRVSGISHNQTDALNGFQNVLPRKLLLIDDVYTTGATLFAAADALRAAGVVEVYGLTFARV